MNYKFPKDFILGVGGSAFQMEGAMLEDGKTLNIREASFYSTGEREPFKDDRAPNVCSDFYHRYPEDLKLMGELPGVHFRYSIAWSRIIPSKDAEPNPKAIDYYNKVIDTMIANGITPFMDLFHADLPLWVLEAGGLPSDEFVSWYTRYAEVCFREFGDRVKYWSTVNEPNLTVFMTYARGRSMPYVSDVSLAMKATHNMILAHYETIKILRKLWPDAKIGAVNNVCEGYSQNFDPEDIAAAERRTACYFLFQDPMVLGEYPREMLELPHIAPYITEEYQRELKEKFQPMDFCGINSYCPKFFRANPEKLFGVDVIPSPYPVDAYGFAAYAPGTYDMLLRMHKRYNGMPIIITENGYTQHRPDGKDMSLEPFQHDEERQEYIREHLRTCARALEAGVNIRGYFYWSFMDSWEVRAGFNVPMGLVGVNFDTLERRPRDSFYYYQKILQNRMVD